MSLLVSLPASAADSGDSRIEAEISVRPALAKYSDLLTTPSYLLVALDNIQASPLAGGRITILDAASFRYRIAEGRFAGRRGSALRYEGKVEWNLAVTSVALSAEVELETARFEQGVASVRVRFPLAGLLPEELIERIRGKLALIGEPRRQDQLLEYLALLQKRINSAVEPKPTRAELILADAHNQSMALRGAVREAGDAEPLSDQLVLILTLLIWAVAVPIVLVLRRRQLARQARGVR